MRRVFDIRFICCGHLLGLMALAGEVPKTWDDRALANWATPVAGLNVRPGHFSETEYYAAPVDNFRTYPVYVPDREPVTYWEWLRKQKPEPLIELGKPRTEGEWIGEGKHVFEELDHPAFRIYDAKVIARVRSSELKPPQARVLHNGTLAGVRWVVTPKGLALGITNCAACHVRIMPDGSQLAGAPQSMHMGINELFGEPFRPARQVASRLFGVPWIKQDVHEQIATMSASDFGLLVDAIIAGTFARFNGSPFYMTKTV
jgi:hypothetical protein